MPQISVNGLVHALRDPRLLPPEQFEELSTNLLPRCPDANILAQELIYRGWLTPYQVHQIARGKANSLVLGSYVLLEPIGEGGMGKVYLARNWKLHKRVAVKIIRKEHLNNANAMRRFRREIRALGNLSHPNIVAAFDADVVNGALFYAMEYVPGTDLGRLVRHNGPLPVDRACSYVAQAACALQHAHEAGLIHRDIKPSNLLLGPRGQVVKLLDLGLARVQEDEPGAAELTRVGALIGTPDFMAPEQAQDSHNADIRSDLYSLGCTFYFLLTGEAPFGKDSPVEKLFLHCSQEPTPVEEVRPGVPHEVAAVVRRLLAKKPEDRHQTPAELIADLLPILRGSRLPEDTPLPERLSDWCLPDPLFSGLSYSTFGRHLLSSGDGSFGTPAGSSDVSPPPPPRQRERFHWRLVALGVLLGLLLVIVLEIALRYFGPFGAPESGGEPDAREPTAAAEEGAEMPNGGGGEELLTGSSGGEENLTG